jgi:Ca2+-binding EF-hand superfamily protein
MAAAVLAALAGLPAAAQHPERKAEEPKAGPPPASPKQGGWTDLDADEFIRRYDKNKDGAVDADEVPAEMRRGFDRVDADDDGRVTADELKRHGLRVRAASLIADAFAALDFEDDDVPAHEGLQKAYEVLRKLDVNKDGTISREEVQVARTVVRSQRAASVLRRHDKDGDGKVSKDEARGLIARFFDRLDRDGDGALTREELTRADDRGAESAEEQQARPRPGRPKDGPQDDR